MLPTPCLVVERSRLQQNAQRMLQVAQQHQVSLRPHVKTHKTIEGAFYQLFGDDDPQMRPQRLQSDECKIVVSTLGEARFFAEAGFQDILYAVPLPLSKLDAAWQLHQKVSHFHVMFDHPAHLQAAEQFWRDHQGEGSWQWSVHLQVDCGDRRCGVDWEDEKGIQLALDIIASPATVLAGIYTHAGHAYKQSEDEQMKQVAMTEQEYLEIYTSHVAEKLSDEVRDAWLAGLTVSVGSTPSLSYPRLEQAVASKGQREIKVNEYHPGNYIYYDLMQAELGSCAIENCAAFVLTTVLSHYPERGELLIDCGALALSKDTGVAQPLQSVRKGTESTWGYIESHPELVITSITQELGVVRVPEGAGVSLDDLPIGSTLRVIPHHSCLTAACFDCVYVMDKGQLVDTWKTAPRT